MILFGFVFLLFPLNSSFGATQMFGNNVIFVFVQTTVRNADGQLVVYLESAKFTDLNLSAIESFLDFEASRGKDPVITIDGGQYQVIRRVQSQTFETEDLVASTILSDNVDGKPVLLARFAHDGYTAIPGDTLESMWTFIRPVA
ncbi:MAG: uncharacterized protein HW410_20 [Nitrosarchaeum sp.]|nr:uncharacterized protein [Nitrosarchaeum sp.]